MAEGWLMHSEGLVARFHHDQRSLSRDPMLFVDYGKEMPDGQPALLKSRRRLRRPEAVELWRKLRSSGWTICRPLWGTDYEVETTNQARIQNQ